MLYDNHGRVINYLRLAVTDRCNLRCFYCMPEEGIKYLPKKELLSFEEMERTVGILAKMGISKIRITGGEPFLRKGMIDFIKQINKIDGINNLHITTNGTLTSKLIPQFREIGIKSVNLSLDSLDEKRFFDITRRSYFANVMETFHQLMEHQIPTKINAVVMDGRNIEDILPLVNLAKDHPVDVRFIEEMPFNGEGLKKGIPWDYKKILLHIKNEYPKLEKIQDPAYSTSMNYQIEGFKGNIGVIAAYSRLFCGTCNRIRLTPTGQLKTCLYDHGVFDLKALIRQGSTDEQLKSTFLEALANRFKDGFEAENNRNNGLPISESMATIGG